MLILGDIRKIDDINQALKHCRNLDGKNRLDVLVNCAGVANAFAIYNFNSKKPQRLKDFLDLVEINIQGTFNVICQSIPLLANTSNNNSNGK